jgi:predicted Zn-dependent protease
MRTPSLLLLAAATALGTAATSHAGLLDKIDLNKAVNTVQKAGKIAKGVTGIGPEEERAIGESVALEIIGRYGGLVRDEAITRRVNLVGRSLAHYSSRSALPWSFGVLDSPSINGFSAPGGYVFITRGLYEMVADRDDALAAVLAHEISHITGRHALSIIERGEFVSGAADLLAERSSDAAQVQAALGQFDLGIEKVLNTLLEKGFDPQTEFAADQRGRELASTVGYAPGALKQVLGELAQKRSGSAGAAYSTHPPLADRIQRLPADAGS